MKVCAACLKSLSKENFSNKQWKLKEYERRCKKCIGLNRVALFTKPHPNNDNVDDNAAPPACWICLDEGPDDKGGRLRRDCSCRGSDAGFAHLSCLVMYAKKKNEENDQGKLTVPWSECPNCHQEYRNELGIELATQLEIFVLDTYPDDWTRLLCALQVKLEKVSELFQCPKWRVEGKKIAETIIAMFRVLKSAATPELLSSMPEDLKLKDACAYQALGIIHLCEGTKESSRTSIGYFEISRDMFKAAGYAAGVAALEQNIAAAKLECGEIVSDVFLDLERSRKIYKEAVKTFGGESIAAIEAGVKYAIALEKTHQGIDTEADAAITAEVASLLLELARTSKRVHGPEHSITKYVGATAARSESMDKLLEELLRFRDEMGQSRNPISL